MICEVRYRLCNLRCRNVNHCSYVFFAEQRSKWNLFEVGKDGKIRLNGKKIDLSKLTADDLRALGIDPNLSEKEIAKKLKVMMAM